MFAINTSLGTYLVGHTVKRRKLYTMRMDSTNLSKFRIAFIRFLAEFPGEVREATNPAKLARKRTHSGVTTKIRDSPFKVESAISYRCTSLHSKRKKMMALLPFETEVNSFMRPSASRGDSRSFTEFGCEYCSCTEEEIEKN
jgi:hypothetical protein